MLTASVDGDKQYSLWYSHKQKLQHNKEGKPMSNPAVSPYSSLFTGILTGRIISILPNRYCEIKFCDRPGSKEMKIGPMVRLEIVRLANQLQVEVFASVQEDVIIQLFLSASTSDKT